MAAGRSTTCLPTYGACTAPECGRYRAALDKLPPITVARDRILVDGWHRWQAHKKENAAEILAEDLGDLSDIEILKEAIVRNAKHGHQLSQADKEKMAGERYRSSTGWL